MRPYSPIPHQERSPSGEARLHSLFAFDADGAKLRQSSHIAQKHRMLQDEYGEEDSSGDFRKFDPYNAASMKYMAQPVGTNDVGDKTTAMRLTSSSKHPGRSRRLTCSLNTIAQFPYGISISGTNRKIKFNEVTNRKIRLSEMSDFSTESELTSLPSAVKNPPSSTSSSMFPMGECLFSPTDFLSKVNHIPEAVSTFEQSSAFNDINPSSEI